MTAEKSHEIKGEMNYGHGFTTVMFITRAILTFLVMWGALAFPEGYNYVFLFILATFLIGYYSKSFYNSLVVSYNFFVYYQKYVEEEKERKLITPYSNSLKGTLIRQNAYRFSFMVILFMLSPYMINTTSASLLYSVYGVVYAVIIAEFLRLAIQERAFYQHVRNDLEMRVINDVI